jgi:hypothetical protein
VTASVLGVLGAAVVVLFLILGLTGGSDEGSKKGGRQKGRQATQQRSSSNEGGSPSQPIRLSLVTRDSMEVCLVTGDGRALIDGQALVSGTEAGPFTPPADNYRLDLPTGGKLTLTLDGEARPVSSRQQASYLISSDGVKSTSFKGPGCP